MFGWGLSYLIKNIHRHVVLSLIAAPINSPKRYENAKDIAVMLEYVAYLCGGTTLTMMDSAIAVIPEPPHP